VLETVLSGITSLPTLTFLLLMLPIHAAIGIVEGLATAALLLFLQRSRPELRAGPARSPQRGTRRPLLLGLALAALLTGSLLPGFASRQPDGLEWSVSRASDGSSTAARAPALHDRLARWQQQLAWLPGYGRAAAASRAGEAAAPWPDIEGRTAWAGVVGGGVTLALVMALGLALRRRRGAA
jgi:cobalt/nickel transport system permease protein